MWDVHSIPRLAAALAFYAVLSLAPFLILMVGASAVLFGEKITHEDTVRDLQEIVGSEATVLIGSVISGAKQSHSTLVSGITAFLLLLFGASGAFVELRSALNYIWGLPEPSTGFTGFLKDRLFAFAMTSALGILLLACLAAGIAIKAVEPFLAKRFQLSSLFVPMGTFVVSFIVTGLVFTLIFRYVPVQPIQWKSAWFGGSITAAAFSLARIPLDLYLAHGSVGSGYGAAASVVVFLMWVYVAAQIFYIGGEFARLHAAPRNAPEAIGVTS